MGEGGALGLVLVPIAEALAGATVTLGALVAASMTAGAAEVEGAAVAMIALPLAGGLGACVAVGADVLVAAFGALLSRGRRRATTNATAATKSSATTGAIHWRLIGP